jgi:hypothetical protein
LSFTREKGRLGVFLLVRFSMDRLAALFAKLLEFIELAELEELVYLLASYEIGEGLGTLYVLAFDTLVVALRAHGIEDPRALDLLLEAAQNREVVLVWALGYFDIYCH